MKRMLVAGLAASLGLALPVLAQQTTPPSAKPNFRDMKSVETWMIATKIDQGGISRMDKTWVIIGTAPEGVYLNRRTLDSTHRRGLKMTTLVNRLELFEPIVDGSRTINSISVDHEIDCLHRTARRKLLTSYAKHNLVGQPVTEKIDEPFTPFDAMLKPVADDICQAIEG